MNDAIIELILKSSLHDVIIDVIKHMTSLKHIIFYDIISDVIKHMTSSKHDVISDVTKHMTSSIYGLDVIRS